MELSLEEIIKLNRIGLSKKRLPNSTDKKITNSGGRVKGRVNKLSRQPPEGRMNNRKPADARIKLIQINRRRMTDARDKLAEIAKKTDARTKIKGRKMSNQNGRQDARGRIGFRQHQMVSQIKPVVLQRSFKNNVATNMRDPSSMIRCTINRSIPTEFPRSYGEDMDIDEPLPMHSHNDLSDIKVALKNDYTQYNRQEYIPSRDPYMDTYEPPMFRVFESSRNLLRSAEPRRMSSEMRARLDTPPRYHRPPSRSPPPPQPRGHRIVVSNLHSSVTHEDIKELFEDIGPLITSRLVRAGTAEVIYEYQKDAKKAVEAYHNRQLDGQPMKCLLVNSNSRPSSSSSSGVLRSSNMPALPKFPNSSKSMVVPDLSAIHKALFTSK